MKIFDGDPALTGEFVDGRFASKAAVTGTLAPAEVRLRLVKRATIFRIAYRALGLRFSAGHLPKAAHAFRLHA
ncbi:hypothetical protein NE852_04240 [Rhizobium sp. Pop5]|uniref:hypothetical protein n=1 Tax=Rhizobium sp. Pop5 TaxID=1223565 RepID=UPI00028397B1|nr:hypothetical protein [Rhizobium sp. Pop5]EJZ22640.1 hypothetical protein RCCGEPOP_03761 [Rhizobium sp. Pop5]UVD57425.1 hypothetical protein NE852_04240 [Rhizobium sp. Pop5]